MKISNSAIIMQIVFTCLSAIWESTVQKHTLFIGLDCVLLPYIPLSNVVILVDIGKSIQCYDFVI